jgi:thiamine biosynthesis lipoprotein
MMGSAVTTARLGDTSVARFAAMASPCEVLLETDSLGSARELGELAAREASRIEAKYSRYRADSVLSQINRSGGAPVAVDEETTALLQFAAHCHQLSEGAFDITSGVLRHAWKFDGRNQLPSPAVVEALRQRVGFERLHLGPGWVTLPGGMEIDFGGIGKEYAVDRVMQIIASEFSGAALVNFGGDLAANRPPSSGPWIVGIERPGTDRKARMLLDLSQGGLATSGDTHRFIEVDGRRYAHILDPRTGWPVSGAPRSVTVAAGSCVEAGMLATMAMLRGDGAEALLEDQGVKYWSLRD